MAIRVLVCDDSLFSRTVITRILESEPGISVCGHAKDGIQAVNMAKELKPDVITMDVIMPRMDGYEAVKRILAQQATPIIVLSSMSPNEIKLSSDIMQLGAFDVISKPTVARGNEKEVREKLIQTVKLAGEYSRELREQGVESFILDENDATFVKLEKQELERETPELKQSVATMSPQVTHQETEISQAQKQQIGLLQGKEEERGSKLAKEQQKDRRGNEKQAYKLVLKEEKEKETKEEDVEEEREKWRGLSEEDLGPFANRSPSAIAIIGSTGATQVISDILRNITPPAPPIFLVQHMPKGFTQAFAARLNRLTKLKVIEVTEDMVVTSNFVFVASSGSHMEVVKRRNKIYVEPTYGAKVGGLRPAAEVTLRSLSKVYHPQLLAVIILSGMGKDGAEAAYEIYKGGGLVLPQNKETSVVYGMPRAFVEKSKRKRTYYPEELAALLELISKSPKDRNYELLRQSSKRGVLTELRKQTMEYQNR